MGDVLTQSQIDELLNSVQSSGSFENPEVETTETSQKYRKYNFHTPKKFTKDRMKLLRSVYDNYARMLSSHLTSLLRIGCEFELFEVEEQRYYEFNNALGDENLLAFIEVNIANRDAEDEPVLIVMSDLIMYTMLDRMLGGSGDLVDTDEEEGPHTASGATSYTDIEIAVYETILRHIAPLADDVWHNYLDVSFKYHKIENNPNLIQVIPIDEIVVILTFNITIKETVGQLTLCFPGSILDELFKQFEQVTTGSIRRKEAQTKDEKENIIKGIENSILEVKAEFDKSHILLEDLYSMNVGDVLNLNLPKNSEVNVYVGEKPWFKGRLGVFKENVAIKLNGMHKEERIRNAGGKVDE